VEEGPVKTSGRAGTWFWVACVVLGAAGVWALAVLALPGTGWLGAAQLTGLGLAFVVGLIIWFMTLEAEEAKQEDRDRAARRATRRQRARRSGRRQGRRQDA
jgi:hypothetical protein